MGVIFVIGLLYTVGFWVSLPQDATRQSKFYPYANGWCWVPAESSTQGALGVYLTLRVLSFAVTAGSFVISVVCLAWIAKILRQQRLCSGASGDAGTFVQSRAFFLFMFAFCFTIEVLNRFNVAGEYLAPVQSFVEPFLPAANGLLFAFSQRLKKNSDELQMSLQGTFGMDVVDSVRASSGMNVTYDEDNDIWLVSKNGEADVFHSELRSHAIAKLFNIHLHLERYFVAGALSFLAGYCDCCGFIALDLFTAHVTGNFATIGMALKIRSFNSIGLKVAGLIVFLLGVIFAHATTGWAGKKHGHFLIIVETMLLFLSWVAAVATGPFDSAEEKNSAGAYLTGLSMVAGLSMQNVYQRKYLVGLPMTTLMTGNTVTLMIEACNELSARWHANKITPRSDSNKSLGPAAGVSAAMRSCRNNLLAIVAYVCGCVAVTAMSIYEGPWAFMVAPMLSMTILLVGWNDLQPDGKSA